MVDYQPRYPQPFTFSDAIQLDVSTITEEISRLQNSLLHLRKTQEFLREVMDSDPKEIDVEVKAALEENQQVILAQEERIMMLKLALAEKGSVMGKHYDLVPPGSSGKDGTSWQNPPEPSSEENEGDQGIHL
ncbi:hypothetical protein E1B28_004256 [Marasmius oreades]|uniref:Uncharacterized protein n=1 Tax=Marasmius oreades TaxID=181124 RepID=A0A9P7UY92_9AGAR|nr:uncharacterized protein E1B28_004256 [Marasmius oreades]KAG7096848.1 hypothetical protein E1B28_004256 [Marasmius oreades]